MAKKINKNYYTTEKIKYIRSKDGGGYVSITNGEYLFSDGIYFSKITKDDLPPSFVEGIYWHRKGYMNAAGVVDLVYKPNKFTNHMFKDDFLYISYKDKIVKRPDDSFERYEGYDTYVCGYNIIEMLKAIEKYSNYDINKIKEQIEDKKQWLKDNYPEDYNRMGIVDFFKE